MALNTIDTLYAEGDITIAKLKECDDVVPILVEHTKTVHETGWPPLSVVICGTIFVLSLIGVIVYLIKSHKPKKGKGNNDGSNTSTSNSVPEDPNCREKRKRESRIEYLTSLKLSYQERILEYIKEMSTNKNSFENDVYIKKSEEYIAKIEEEIEQLRNLDKNVTA